MVLRHEHSCGMEPMTDCIFDLVVVKAILGSFAALGSKRAFNPKTACRREKRAEIWDLGTLVTHGLLFTL